MIPEILDNPNVGNLLRGASIILSVEPEAQLPEALVRSKNAEGRSEDDLDEAIRLIAKVSQELELNGEKELDREQARKALNHILADPPFNRISDKHDVI
ncbi:MAG: hypothetical protein AAB908_00210 [Patescibacteria group bacterium]